MLFTMMDTPVKFTRWAIGAVALASFAAGSVITTCLIGVTQARADVNRLFELRIYHTMPGKLPALKSRFGTTTSRLLARHGLKVVGFWVHDDDRTGDNSFIFLVAHDSREQADKHWAAMMADPGFQAVIQAEQADKTVQKVDVMFMRPTDFSPMK